MKDCLLAIVRAKSMSKVARNECMRERKRAGGVSTEGNVFRLQRAAYCPRTQNSDC